MRVKVVAVTLALSLPSFLWPPKPARAATVDIAPAMPEPAFNRDGVLRPSRDASERPSGGMALQPRGELI